MDDQFLHHLRREPPAAFAARLKWQLDRPVALRPRRTRYVLGLLAVFGTAFALMMPATRHTLLWVFQGTSQNSSEPASAPLPAGLASRATSSVPVDHPNAPASRPPLAQYASPEPVSPAPQTAPPSIADDQPAPPSNTESATGSAYGALRNTGRPPPTREQLAVQATLTRQGLFKLLAFATQPLSAVRQGAPLDLKVVQESAIRLQRLSDMIPDVFQTDTTAAVVNTRASDIIWLEPADFRAKADDLTVAAQALAASSAVHDVMATVRAIDRVVATCNACHGVYMKK
jgi:cytochrome c556